MKKFKKAPGSGSAKEGNNVNLRKGQTVSLDAVIAIVLFTVASILLFHIIGREQGNEQFQSIEKDSEKLTSVLASSKNLSVSMLDGSTIDEERLRQLLGMDYHLLKTRFGIASDFCIYFEDDQGNLVPVSEKSVGVGSSAVKIGGVSCNRALP